MTNPVGCTWDRARILIVDDEQPVRLALQAILAEHYDILLAEDAVQAELLLENMPVQVVLTDFNLPGRSGTDLISSVLSKYPEVVVILLTGYASKPAVRTAGRDRNVFAVLTKPYEPAALLRSLRLAVATSHLLTLRHNPAGRKTAG
jgi:DNA-binding NtrC family response regulator